MSESELQNAAQSHSLRASCSDRRPHAQASAPSALAARLPPNSPGDPIFLAEYPTSESALGRRPARTSASLRGS